MARVFLVRAILSGIVVVAAGTLPCRAQQANQQPETLIRLSVAPAAAAKPSLKYQLLPELEELSPGNPVEGYLKCYLGQYRFRFVEEEFERKKPLLAMPLDEPPVSDTREVPAGALPLADQAARLTSPEWQILLKLKADGINTLLPDVQGLRAVARTLQTRFRSEVASGRIDDALRTAKTMFAMSRHMGVHPTAIGELIAMAIAFTAISPLEELLEQQDCPNLYWALTNLPDPLISISSGMAGERMIVKSLFREVDTKAPMSAQQIKKFIEPLEGLLFEQLKDKPPGGIAGYLAARAKDEKKMAAARQRLRDSGFSEELLKTFPNEQVILIDEARECQERFDEIARITVFPAAQFEALAEKIRAQRRDPALFGDALQPFQYAVRRAQGRIQQRIALLRHVEALRMYAADHNGVFPAQLADVTVPLPVDPFTEKPFVYERSGETVHLRGTPPEAEKSNVGFRIHYEVTLKH